MSISCQHWTRWEWKIYGSSRAVPLHRQRGPQWLFCSKFFLNISSPWRVICIEDHGPRVYSNGTIFYVDIWNHRLQLLSKHIDVPEKNNIVDLLPAYPFMCCKVLTEIEKWKVLPQNSQWHACGMCAVAQSCLNHTFFTLIRFRVSKKHLMILFT